MEPAVNSSGIVDPEAGQTDPNVSPPPTTDESEAAKAPTSDISCIYFGYGSNLSPRTMKQRCPGSLFVGLAVLQDWKWMINETRYANIIPSPGDHVYGSLCFLSGKDEAALDDSEGVPWMYEKMHLKVKQVVREGEEAEWGEGRELEALAYVDVQRLTPGIMDKEYVVWVNKAIEDGAMCGMPREYADKYLAPFLPANKGKGLPDIVMVRTTQLGEQERTFPKGFASWARG